MSEADFHPRYRSDGDIVLLSLDGVKFRVHSAILVISSDFFRQMFELPQPSSTAGTPVQMDEESTLLAILLDLVYPRGSLPIINDIDVVRRVANVAEKFEMSRALNTLSAIVRIEQTNKEINEDTYPPLDTYAVACQHRWMEVMEDASRRTLAYSVKELVDIFLRRPVEEKKLDLKAEDMLRLIDMHERRKKQIIDGVSPYLLQKHGHTISTCSCIEDDFLAYNTDDHALSDQLDMLTTVLQGEVGLELMDSTDAMNLKDNSFWDSESLKRVWKHKCVKCGRPLINKDKYIGAVRQTIDEAIDTVIFSVDRSDTGDRSDTDE
ncbi:hypothetical protein EW145_g7432 [Phellinidium pouzarii]|uniref:BTB domain-containing protein n=1 Tax=Phellinidium pouzarii TaxID=167371 RepID=A0A4S4KJ63_9AGAM|nr:hypothetical protein EW145_g7432 [Phellinidium pouzarii]